MFEKDIDALIGHDDSEPPRKKETKQRKTKGNSDQDGNTIFFATENYLKPEETKNDKKMRITTRDLEKEGEFEEKTKLDGGQ